MPAGDVKKFIVDKVSGIVQLLWKRKTIKTCDNKLLKNILMIQEKFICVMFLLFLNYRKLSLLLEMTVNQAPPQSPYLWKLFRTNCTTSSSRKKLIMK